MIEIAELEQYIPNPNNTITEGSYTFNIKIYEKKETFFLNLNIKQKDSKEEHHIKFHLGIGKDEPAESLIHKSDEPHFQIHINKRGPSFGATLYFTFDEIDKDELLKYAKGTLVMMTKIIKSICNNNNINKNIIELLLYEKAIMDDLNHFEQILIEALYKSFKNKGLVARENGKKISINTEHKLQNYLNVPDLEPLYLPLLKKVQENN